MLRRKQLKKPSPDGLFRRTRSGMIADSDWLAVEIRDRLKETKRAVAAAKKCIKLGKRATDELKVTELLKLIRRYCTWQGLEYHELDSEAGQLYVEEMSEEQPCGRWLDAPDPRRPAWNASFRSGSITFSRPHKTRAQAKTQPTWSANRKLSG